MLFEFETTGLDIQTEPSNEGGGGPKKKLEQILMKLYYNRVNRCINVVHYLTP